MMTTIDFDLTLLTDEFIQGFLKGCREREADAAPLFYESLRSQLEDELNRRAGGSDEPAKKLEFDFRQIEIREAFRSILVLRQILRQLFEKDQGNKDLWAPLLFIDKLTIALLIPFRAMQSAN